LHHVTAAKTSSVAAFLLEQRASRNWHPACTNADSQIPNQQTYMKATKILLTFVIGVLVGIAGHWYMTQPQSQDLVASARQNVSDGATQAGESLKQTFDTDKARDGLNRAGEVVREKADKAGEAVTDASANIRITTAIKAKLIADSGLSAFKIDVDTADGVVTLSGTVASPEDIAKATKLAQETEGVRQVISTLLVKAD
jgi:hypothetical protein